MNRKITVAGMSVFAVVGAILLFPGAIAIGGDPLDIKAYNITEETNNDIKSAVVVTQGSIVSDGTDGAFGYGIFLSSGDLLVTTTHGGVYDSETQTAGNPEPVWHNHIVQLNGASTACSATSGVEVADLTFESPGAIVIQDDRVRMTNINSGPYTGQLSGTPLSQDGFDVSQGGVSVSFTLRPVDDSGNTTLDAWTHVCVENINAEGDTTPQTFELTQTIGRP